MKVRTTKTYGVSPEWVLASITGCWAVHCILCIPFSAAIAILLEEEGDAEALDQVVDMFAAVFNALYHTCTRLRVSNKQRAGVV